MMDRSRGLDELRERRLPREVSAGAGVEYLDQAPIVFSRAQHQHLAFRNAGLDGGRRPGTVGHREVDVEDRHVRERALCLGDGLQAVTRLGHHVDLGLALEDRPHRFTEERVPVGQEDPDAIRWLRQKNTLSQPRRYLEEDVTHRLKPRHAPETVSELRRSHEGTNAAGGAGVRCGSGSGRTP
jgi:hypothetical protein